MPNHDQLNPAPHSCWGCAVDRALRDAPTRGRKTGIPFADGNPGSRRISKGSRLVVVLNVDKKPYMEINHGTGTPVADESIADAGQPLQIEWYNDSYITVPVMSDPRTHVHDEDQ